MADDIEILRELEKKILWLASWMVHHANHLRESDDGMKGRGASGLLRLSRHDDRPLFFGLPAE